MEENTIIMNRTDSWEKREKAKAKKKTNKLCL